MANKATTKNNNKKKQQYSKDQILDSLAKWTNVMLESGNATMKEVEDLLGEGLLKSLGSKIKSGLEAAGGAVKDAVSGAGEAIHDAFLKNAGVKKFLESLKAAGDADINALKMVAVIGSEKYPVVDVDIPKKFKKTLVLSINPEVKDLSKCLTVAALREAIKAAGIKKMSASIDGIVCGAAQAAVDQVAEATAKKPADKKAAGKKAGAAPQDPNVPTFAAEPVPTQSGETIKIADKNKLLDVKYDKAGFIGFMFDKSKDVKKAEKAEEEIFS